MDCPDKYNLCLISDWEYDRDFILMVEEAAYKQSLSTYIIWPENLDEAFGKLRDGWLHFDYFFDRACGATPEFLDLHKFLRGKNVPVFEPLENLQWASDKATMHLEFIASGIVTPHTIILPPFCEAPEINLKPEELVLLGKPFVIKPANTTGGGIGVQIAAESMEDVLAARREFEDDKYLLQERINPLVREGKRFWFRGFYSCDLVQLVWWDDVTHQYERVDVQEIGLYELHPLFSLVQKVAKICKLHLFSTEIALDPQKGFIIVDYVNELCDMRLKSRHHGGVPDGIVENIAQSLAAFMRQRIL